jgi:hypothetical protein
MYEGGIREPLLVRAPGWTPAGSVSDTVVSSIDFFPTLLEWCGLEGSSELDGQSFAPALRGEEQARGPIYWHYPHYGNQGGQPSAAVRDGDWKLIRWFETGQEELFRLDLDIGEQYDLAAREPEERARLAGLLDAWLADVDAQFATPNNKALDETNGPKGIERLAWLAGHWSREHDGMVFEEAWLAPRGRSMLGVNRVANAENTYAHESLRIYEEDGALYYEASPSGQAKTRFTLTSANGQRAVFENPEHDFPQVIEYRLDGDELRAFIRGPGDDGATREVEFRWTRQP